ncbi:MAG: hypothetical protein H6733_16130 [Alphaproteobacteria bacterium]|nr:hypothetical protein [Alphaproteobacteria bacterium]
MRLSSLAPHLVVALALAGCAPDVADDDVDDVTTCDAGPKRVGLITKIRFTRPSATGVSDGFDLDDLATGQGQAGGCNVADDTSPDGQTGIDNAFARLLPALELTEAQAIESIMQDTINQGNLLVLVQLDDLDDPVDDTCVGFDVLRAQGIPRVGAPGFITSGQTFDLDPTVPGVHAGTFPLVDGTIVARPITLSLPVQVLAASLDFTLEQGAMRITLNDDGTFQGILGGGVDVQQLIDAASFQNINPEVLALLEAIIGPVTDLWPDESGTCTHISVTFDIEGVEAFVYEDSLPIVEDTGGNP